MYFSFKEVLRKITSSKKSSIEFLQKHGVIPSEMICPGPTVHGKRNFSCGNYMALKDVKDRKDRLSWRCRKIHKFKINDKDYVNKNVKVSIREGSWLKDAKLTLEQIIELMYLWSQGFTNKEIEHELKLSNKTIVEWTIFFRECITCSILKHSEQIGGEGIEVEIDESKFGKRKYYRGRRVEGQWIFGGREKKDHSKVFMVPVKRRDQKTLLPIIQKWIAPGSIIHSDCWKSYNKLSSLGYTHLTVNHSKEFVNNETGACTNGIESDWRHAKVSMPRYGVHKGLHSGYLAEFMWRRKYYQHDKFLKLISDINTIYHKGEVSQCPSK